MKTEAEVKAQLAARKKMLDFEKERGDDPRWTHQIAGSVNALCWVLGLPTTESVRDWPASTASTLKAELWCVHVLGPDTIIPQPDYETAVRRAAEWVAMFQDIKKRRGSHPYDPIMHCNVVPYTGSAESHAAELAEHGGAPGDIC